MKTLHKTAISAAAVALLSGVATTAAFAEEAAAPEVSPITANVTVASNYIYRGLTQTNNKPAIQGGFDYAHESGFYVGNWNSSISWISDSYGANGYGNKQTTPGASVTGPIEMDFYAGFKKELIAEGFATDVGVLQYYYPTSGLPNYTYAGNATTLSNAGAVSSRQFLGYNPSTTEIYAAQNFTAGPVTGFLKVSYAATNLFGIYNSAGSMYPDLTANYDTGFYGITLNAHAGYQYVPNNITQAAATATTSSPAGTYNLSYADWKLGLTKDFGGGLSGSAYYTGTTAQKVSNVYVYATPLNGNQGRGNAVVSLTKTF
ncbi:hypothetical protein C2740_08705 [Polynucleobacter sp. MG-5-Ahmo-C2]|jgi:Bacterial protein of unknown function (Gcw_chp)|uniref:TorF family putative porin n=1 Tax=Polynucleobacter sp. MG-5-Ahmo-C2 TaxID=2081051 RepID=UPI001BFD9499|nr:TorF family putative porin [Polynucleobacter sp. MG-5-Ahmo-C2]QWD98409.1 hypothetical protein C2740_08705 [Polynucleobacter sp. MG-5-Ahmo-C2]